MKSRTNPEMPALRGPVSLSHLLIQQFVKPGDCVIDATCGNGHDTVLLAELVGPNGRVTAFDIQERAISATSDRLRQAGLLEHTRLIHAGHEFIASFGCESTSAAVFNLGYLPGGDRSLITRPDTTLIGVDQALAFLKPGGIVAISIYPGHEGGGLEQDAVDSWATNLVPAHFHVWRMVQMNVSNDAPYLILIQKAS